MTVQWNLSNADTIGTAHACSEYGGRRIWEVSVVGGSTVASKVLYLHVFTPAK